MTRAATGTAGPGLGLGLALALSLSLVLPLVVLAGCATTRRPVATGPDGCLDADYRGSFREAARPDDPRNFRMSARVCGPGTPVVLELRGAVGGAALVAAVRPGEDVRLLFPSRRLYADGPDEPDFWRRFTGVALDGRLLRGLADEGASAGDGGWQAPPGWTAEIAPAPAGERLPARLEARSAAGDGLRLEKTRERPSRAPAAWPEVPRGFRPAQPADMAAGDAP